ncbi:hypothetical protein [Abditibacterium utsteinense]|uniref:hypothetical protein n=1 Tax=Abditibacterium utsteinense TaxID=1960156 RepID=UPI0019310806|nr:hypothetical protein [Abditibacterium utsteinense]
MNSNLFPSFFQGGFECSTHRRSDGARLDLVEATRHDAFAARDYEQLQNVGLFTARDGIRWHLIESRPDYYNWSSALSQVRAAHQTGQTVIWDVLHYGWPDFWDIWSPQWVEKFANFAGAFAMLLKNESDGPFFFAPVNEPSFFAFAGGSHGFFAPYGQQRGLELKKQMVRAVVAASEAIWDVLPEARLIHTDPLIHVEARPGYSQHRELAGFDNQAQFEAFDMICGRAYPELGGQPHYLDVVGANFYVHNQWFYPGGHGTLIPPSHPQHRPLRFLLEELWNRYQRPLFIAETGIEEEARPQWLCNIAIEARAALLAGVPLEGICLYPICNHPGWDNGRHCHNGLFDYADDRGEREIYAPLSAELALQIQLTEQFFAASPYEREEIVAAENEAEIAPPELDRVAREMEAAAAI